MILLLLLLTFFETTSCSLFDGYSITTNGNEVTIRLKYLNVKPDSIRWFLEDSTIVTGVYDFYTTSNQDIMVVGDYDGCSDTLYIKRYVGVIELNNIHKEQYDLYSVDGKFLGPIDNKYFLSKKNLYFIEAGKFMVK